MKTLLYVSHSRIAGLTLVEVIVIVSIVSVLIGLTIPCTHGVNKKGLISDSMGNAKQIAVALRIYAEDNDGKFPIALADGKKLTVGDPSNRVFEQLMPKYTTSGKIFMNKRSAWCANPATDTVADDACILKRGQNDWNYVTGLKDDADPAWPLIANATASATNLTYTNTKTAKGGVWGGTDAVVGFVDGSVRLISGTEMNSTDKTRTFPKRKDTGGNLFIATPGWLSPGCVVLVPE